MNKLFLGATAALLMATGIAFAQTTTSETTTTVTPAPQVILVQPSVTKSVTRIETVTPVDNTETAGRANASRNIVGQTEDSVTTTSTTTYAPAVQTITRSTATSTN